MGLFLFANNASSVLASAISSTATVIDLSPGTGALFPNPAAGQQFTLTLNDAATGLVYEIVYCTARSADTLTVVRGQEGTAPVSWLANDRAFLTVTAGALDSLAPLASPAFTGIPTVPTAVGGTNTTQAASTAFVAANFAAIAGNTAQQFSVAPGTADTQAAALAQVFGWKAGTLSGNHTIAAADGGTIFAVTAASAVITLPAASTVTNQTGGVIAEAACTVTLASGTLEGGSLEGSTSVALAVGDFLYWQAGATNWRVLGAAPHLVGAHGFEAFLSSGTFTVPAGVFSVLVTCVGGGGGGSGCQSFSSTPANTNASGGGGGAGGTAIGIYAVTPGQGITVTVGAGATQGSTGGTSSFGSFCSATGGQGSVFTATAVSPGGAGGTGSGGDSNIDGGDGSDGQNASFVLAGNGGASIFGGGGRAGAHGGEPGSAVGSGGGGAYDALATGVNYTGGTGANGVVLVRW